MNPSDLPDLPQRKSTSLCRLLANFIWRNKGHEGGDFGEFSKQAKARGIKVVFPQASFSNLTNVFVKVIVFPLNFVFTVLLAFLVSKATKVLWRSLFQSWVAHETGHFRLFVQNSLWIFFDRRTRYYWKNLIDCNHYLLHNKQKLLGMRIFPKIVSIARKRPVKVTSNPFLLREVEQLPVYQLLPKRK